MFSLFQNIKTRQIIIKDNNLRGNSNGCERFLLFLVLKLQFQWSRASLPKFETRVNSINKLIKQNLPELIHFHHIAGAANKCSSGGEALRSQAEAFSCRCEQWVENYLQHKASSALNPDHSAAFLWQKDYFNRPPERLGPRRVDAWAD